MGLRFRRQQAVADGRAGPEPPGADPVGPARPGGDEPVLSEAGGKAAGGKAASGEAASGEAASAASAGTTVWWRRPLLWAGSAVIAPALALALSSLTTGGFSSLGHHIFGPGRPAHHGGTPPPFGWTVSRSANERNDCSEWSFDKPISAIPLRDFHSYQNAAADEKWVLRNGGTDMSGAYTITLQGNSAPLVDIEDIRVRVVSRTRVHAGTIIASNLGCGGGIPVRSFDLAIDARAPHLVPDSGIRIWPYKISATDVEQLCLNAFVRNNAGKYAYSFVYEIDWAQGSKTGTTEIRNLGGRPFTALPEADVRGYYNYGGRWVKFG
jgi:hypothetical protein